MKKSINNTEVSLKPALKSDLELILAWRSHPLIYKYFRKQSKPLTWKEHIEFWASRKNRKDFIILLRDGQSRRKIGTINISKLDTDYPEIGILIGELTYQGKGIGSQALILALKWLKQKKYKNTRVEVNKNNMPSSRLFLSNGFIKNQTDGPWIKYEKHI